MEVDAKHHLRYACANGVRLDDDYLRRDAACTCISINPTSNRVRAYAPAAGVFEPAEANGRWLSKVALSELRLQRQGADLAWYDVAGTTVNDLDGWQGIDDVIGVTWPCNPAGGTFRAAAVYQRDPIGPAGPYRRYIWTNPTYTYYGYEC